jgi:hypothetical protein
MAYGDHLVVGTKYPLIEHHGIECGLEGGEIKVIHFVKDENQKLTIEKTSLNKFANGRQVKIIDYSLEKCLCPCNVVKNAEKLYYDSQQNSEQLSYHLINFNCEHLATLCKTGFQESCQSLTFVLYLSLLIRIPLAICFGAVGAGFFYKALKTASMGRTFERHKRMLFHRERRQRQDIHQPQVSRSYTIYIVQT